jgi:hypothetical protein
MNGTDTFSTALRRAREAVDETLEALKTFSLASVQPGADDLVAPLIEAQHQLRVSAERWERVRRA